MSSPTNTLKHYCTHAYFLLALALGPQFDSGFEGNLANFSSFDGGLASFRISNDASILTWPGDT